MDNALVWKKFFEMWPAELPPTGVLVAGYGEQIPFESFLVGEDLVLLERKAPDTVGARKLLMPYGEIRAVKLTEVIKPRVMQAAGFRAVAPAPKPGH
ncbi:MAG: hypothetical protein K1X74_22440 [Pirellulales bacterium]|nr:hypothetical protein [Pirellulales bacterium]